jgi:FKBP-type peptidyl-prolyl cis-trans isomerase SlpA
MSKSVQSNSAVLVHFTLKLEDGSTAESTRNNGKPALFRLGDGSLSEGLEQHLLGLKAGDKSVFAGTGRGIWHAGSRSDSVFLAP